MSTEKLTVEAPAVHRALEKTAIRASFWTILEYGSGMGLRVVSSLVLTRLLLPAYFGEMALVTTLIVGITLLSDIGLAPSVTQSPRGDDPIFLNTAWTIQAFRGVILWLIAIAISWPVAKFYHDPKLTQLLPVLAACTMIGGFNSTNLLTLSRHMEVKRLFLIDVTMSIVSLVVTIALAYRWPSVWSIVAGQVAGTVVRLCISHIPSLTPGIRNSFCWDRESVHSIVHLGRWILIATAFFFFASQADRLILGRLITLSLLGIYGIAYSLSDIPRAVILALASRVAYPFIAKMIHLPMSEFRLQFLRYRFLALVSGASLLSVMVIWGNLLILHLYDHRYKEAAWMIPILALGLWHTLLYQTTYPVLLALGKAKYNAIGNIAYCAAMFIGIPIAFHYYGLLGAVITIAAGDLPLYASMQFGATRNGIRPLRQDLQATGIFIGLLVLCFFLKRSLS